MATTFAVGLEFKTIGSDNIGKIANQLGGVGTAAVKAGSEGANAGRRIDSAFSGLKGKLSGALAGFQSIGGVLASLGVGAVVREFAAAGLEAERTGKTIQALAGQYGEVAGVSSIAARAAKEFSIGQTAAQKAVADLYGRLRPTGVSLKQIETVFFGVNKAAAAMNLTAADTDGVLLQLSQALGSGALQGDELRSIMERMPAVGQAVAKVMGVTVGEVKKLGAEGKITTDVMIKAAAELQNIKPPPPDGFKQFNAAMEDLKTSMGKDILPAVATIVQGLSGLVQAFGALPAPVRQTIAVVGLVAAAFVIVAPAISAVVTLFTTIGPAVAAVVSAISAVVGALTAGGGLASAMGIIAGIFTGPVGWVALLVAAGAALWAFRDQIGQWIKDLGALFAPFAKFIDDWVVQPFQRAFSSLVQAASAFGQKVAEAVQAPMSAIGNVVKGVINAVLAAVENGINGAISALNSLIATANRALAALKMPQLPQAGSVSLPRLAEGGYITKPTVAEVGEAGPEYVIPAGKMDEAMARYSAGARGNSVVPQVNVAYHGSTVRMGGQDYISRGDVPGLITSAVQQTIRTLGASPQARRSAGVR